MVPITNIFWWAEKNNFLEKTFRDETIIYRFMQIFIYFSYVYCLMNKKTHPKFLLSNLKNVKQDFTLRQMPSWKSELCFLCLLRNHLFKKKKKLRLWFGVLKKEETHYNHTKHIFTKRKKNSVQRGEISLFYRAITFDSNMGELFPPAIVLRVSQRHLFF